MRYSSEPSVRLFGTFEYRYVLEPPSGPARKLLARLILSSHRAHGRAELAETLWPEADPDRARFYLRRALTQLRPLLPEMLHLETTRETVRLKIDSEQADALAFDAAVRSGDEAGLARAVELHTAPLLADWTDEWLIPERESRRLAWHRAIETLAASDLQHGRPAEAARRLTFAVEVDPLRESSQRLLIEALRQAGDRLQAERQYQRLERGMRSTFGLSPSAETRETLRRTPPLPPLPVASGAERHLPVVLTELVGREEAVANVLKMLGTSRLVTLVGTGGIGKTRLALACAEAASCEPNDLVAMVDLASQENGRSLGDLLARSIKAPPRAGASGGEAALCYLEERRALILLDNCEHVIDTAGELAQSILDRCPRVTILATSRQALELPDEAIFEVPPLDLTSAETLFLQTVARKGKRIPESHEIAEHVRRICLALDGLPLALNLAASALRTTTLPDLASDIHAILGDDRSPRPRHRSMRTAAEWSYRLLSDDEARLMRSVSPIHGFWTVEYAHAAVGLDAASLDAVRCALRGLVAKSLVSLYEDEKGTRFRILEPLREDAYRRLKEAGEETEVRNRLRDAVLKRSREIACFYQIPLPAEALRRAEGEMEAIETVLQDCLRSTDGTVGMEIVRNINPLLDYTNRYRDGVFYQERFLADTPDLDPVHYISTCAQIVHLRTNWGDGQEILPMGEETVALARRSGDEGVLAYALCSLSAAAYYAGQYARAKETAEEALHLWTCAGRWTSVGSSSVWAAKAALGLEDWAAAEAHLDRAEPLVADHGAAHICAVVNLNRGRLCFRRGALDDALRLFTSAESSFTEVGDRVHAAAARVGQAACLARRGDGQHAGELLKAAEESVSRLIGDPKALYDGLGSNGFRECLWSQVRSALEAAAPPNCRFSPDLPFEIVGSASE